MNDDASKAIDYVLELFKEAVLEGRKPAKKETKK
jgi:ribosomal protein S2